MANREDLMLPALATSKSSSTNPFDNESVGDEQLHSGDPADSELTDSVVGSTSQSMNPVKYSLRGGLISGHVIDAEAEIRRTMKNRDDVESGSWPPDSDYASRAPRSIWEPAFGEEDQVDDNETPTKQPVKKVRRRSDSGHTNGGPTKRRSILRILLGVTVFVLVLAVVAVILIVRSSKNSSDKESRRVVGTPRQEALDAILVTASTEEALSAEDSPQSRARKWLLFEDELALDPRNDYVSETRVIQRYSMAVLYFATDGEKSWGVNNWLKGGECDGDYWNFIDCNKDNQVHAIVFDNIDLSGEIPPEVGHLAKLASFIIKSAPELVGSIPPALGHLYELEQLGISFTGVGGVLPSELFRATSLRYLNLQNNALEKTIPTDVSLVSSLEKLILSNNELTGTVPWDSLPKEFLQVLALDNNQFEGIISKTIESFPNLSYIYLDKNKMGGTIPSELGNTKSLRSIKLDHNSFGERIPRSISRLTDLEYLSIQYNRLTGPIPSEVQHLTRLNTLALGGNKLTGELPGFHSLRMLKHLYLFENNLGGAVPEYVYDLNRLEILFLSSNNFTGPILFSSRSRPSSRLRGLYLSDNKFHGHIPMALCEFRSLEAIFLDENELMGNLPACLALLRELKQLYVFKNQLNGDIPNELSILLKLEGLGLEQNEFGGVMPQGLCLLADQNDMELWSDCGGDPPKIGCECCTTCCLGSNCTTPVSQ